SRRRWRRGATAGRSARRPVDSIALRRRGFNAFFTIEIADLATTDIGAITRTVASAGTSKEGTCPAARFVVLAYRPGSARAEQHRTALAKVTGGAMTHGTHALA